jgi:hypothetical protein
VASTTVRQRVESLPLAALSTVIGASHEAEVIQPGRSAFLVGVPLAWAVLLLFHPTGDE